MKKSLKYSAEEEEEGESGGETASARGYFSGHGQNMLLGSLHLGMSQSTQKPTPW